MRILPLLLALLLTLPFVSAEVITSLAPGTQKIRPWDDLTVHESITVHVVRGQWANLQAITRIEGTEQVELTIEATTPTRGEEALWEPEVYRIQSISIVQPSMDRSLDGEWPDALIPEEDHYFQEDRNAYPFTLRNVGPAYAYSTTTNKYYPDVPYMNNRADKAPLVHGTYTGTAPRKYWIEITKEGAPGDARFSYSHDEGATWHANETIPTSTETLVPIDAGISLRFPEQYHGEYDAEDRWEYYAAPYRNEAAYIDIFIPEEVSPGAYTGVVRFILADETIEHPYTIVVHDLTIPRTGSVHTAFWGSMSLIPLMHTGTIGDYRDESNRPLWNRYIEEGLYHRITTTDMLPWMDWDGERLTGTSAWKEAARTYMDGAWTYGARFTQLQLPVVRPHDSYHNIIGIREIWHPRITDYDIKTEDRQGDFIMGEPILLGENKTAHCNYGGDCREIANVSAPPEKGDAMQGLESGANATISTSDYYDIIPTDSFILPHLYELITTEGYFDETINLLSDEPWWEDININDTPPQEFTDTFRRIHGHMEQEMPGLTQMIINRYVEDWADYAEVWVPAGAQCPVGRRDKFGCNITSKADQEERDMEYWMYIVGINPTNPDRFQYIPDTPYEQVRGIGWLMHVGDIQGLLHYKISRCTGINTARSWENIYYTPYGNDNCLIYPGYPEKIGGTTDIPVASWRLKQLRQGLEELEVLRLASEQGHSDYTHERVEEEVGTYWGVFELLPTTDGLNDAYEEILQTVAPYSPTCGDDVCELNESEGSCAEDCSCYAQSITGDLTCDGAVDIFDLTLVGSSFGCIEGQPCWVEKGVRADACTADHEVDVGDLACVSAHFGEQQ